jgi:hypothetical protein
LCVIKNHKNCLYHGNSFTTKPSTNAMLGFEEQNFYVESADSIALDCAYVKFNKKAISCLVYCLTLQAFFLNVNLKLVAC